MCFGRCLKGCLGAVFTEMMAGPLTSFSVGRGSANSPWLGSVRQGFLRSKDATHAPTSSLSLSPYLPFRHDYRLMIRRSFLLLHLPLSLPCPSLHPCPCPVLLPPTPLPPRPPQSCWHTPVIAHSSSRFLLFFHFICFCFLCVRLPIAFSHYFNDYFKIVFIICCPTAYHAFKRYAHLFI